MPAIDKLITAVQNGHKVTSVRFAANPDEMHTVITTDNGKVGLKLGKTVTPATLWLARQTQRLRKKGTLGPNSSTNINTVEVYITGAGWMPLKSMPTRRSPAKKKPDPSLRQMVAEMWQSWMAAEA